MFVRTQKAENAHGGVVWRWRDGKLCGFTVLPFVQIPERPDWRPLKEAELRPPPQLELPQKSILTAVSGTAEGSR